MSKLNKIVIFVAKFYIGIRNKFCVITIFRCILYVYSHEKYNALTTATVFALFVLPKSIFTPLIYAGLPL